jgi:hypothetical protein
LLHCGAPRFHGNFFGGSRPAGLGGVGKCTLHKGLAKNII